MAIGAGFVIGSAAGTFHWWKRKLNDGVRSSIERSVGWWGALALVLMFVFLVGPNIYHRAIGLPQEKIIFANAILKGWSYHDGVFEADVDSGPIIQFKDDYRLVLLVKPPILGSDRM